MGWRLYYENKKKFFLCACACCMRLYLTNRMRRLYNNIEVRGVYRGDRGIYHCLLYG